MRTTKKNKIKCQGECKRELSEERFYKSKSPFFPNGRVNICKDCIRKMVKDDDISTVYSVCQALDIPFFEDIWKRCQCKNYPMGDYIRQANSGINQFKDARWTDSVFGNKNNNSNNNNNNNKQLNMINNEEDEDNERIYSEVWRGNYTRKDIEYLDNYFKDLQKDFNIITRNHVDYARKIAKASLAMDSAYEDMLDGVSGADTRYKNLKDTFDQLSKSAQFSEINRNTNNVGLGSYAEVFEKVEKRQWIPKHTPIDKDDIDKMIEAFATINKSL